MDERRSRVVSSVADALNAAMPIELLTERIQPAALEALARWRDVDVHNLSSLSTALYTQSGAFAADSPGYLSALHGFVAEQLAADQLGVVLPVATNVAAVDVWINGVPYQIKEGTTAYESVREALARYPDVTHFITDPATAARLHAEGVDAIGIAALSPDHVADVAGDTVAGMHALSDAGALHFPFLTAVLSVCRYWEAYDSERLDAPTAVARAGVDVGAQAIGAALGLKIAAVGIVATGAFAVSALPLTVAAIAGAMGLRALVAQNRARPLQEALAHFDRVREAAETASSILVDRSREYVEKLLSDQAQRRRAAANDAQQRWHVTYEGALGEAITDLERLASKLLERLEGVERKRWTQSLSGLYAIDASQRYDAMYAAIRSLLSEMDLPEEFRARVEDVARAAEARLEHLRDRQDELRDEAAQRRAQLDRALKVELIAEYGLLLEQMARVVAPVRQAFDRVVGERERLGLVAASA